MKRLRLFIFASVLTIVTLAAVSGCGGNKRYLPATSKNPTSHTSRALQPISIAESVYVIVQRAGHDADSGVPASII